MGAYEARRRRILTTGSTLTALTLYLLLAFTALSGRDFVAGAEGAYAGAGDPGVLALGAVDEALRAGPSALPAPEIDSVHAWFAAEPNPLMVLIQDAVRAARTPLEDQQVLRL